MSEWQDISTAPKDGTPIIAWWRHLEKPLIAWWSEQKNYRAKSARWVVSHSKWQTMKMVTEPTHWMPLPSPPTNPEGGD